MVHNTAQSQEKNWFFIAEELALSLLKSNLPIYLPYIALFVLQLGFFPGHYVPPKFCDLQTQAVHLTFGHAPFSMSLAAPHVDFEDFLMLTPHTPIFLPPATS